ncbi:hypothetical protein [Synechococcus sp. PCC 6312]|uniref:hypothetical protein n=1 Tax=Synechococcus sp. (strain ATCC 27167 / PCC 6312) TaxID=195253 RepID=UPI00059C85D8|nr:hypothetical protein [Synechococcus sp. PCC 6312]
MDEVALFPDIISPWVIHHHWHQKTLSVGQFRIILNLWVIAPAYQYSLIAPGSRNYHDRINARLSYMN